MEESGGLAENSCCYGCLSKNDVNPLQLYKVQNEALRAMFQADCIYFCYLCKRRAQQAELFIRNVQSNQILLENCHNLTDSMLKIIKKQNQLLINLSYCNTEGLCIESGNNDELNVEESFSDKNNSTETKLELEDKGNVPFDQLDTEYLEDDFEDLYSDFKEDNYPLISLREYPHKEITEGEEKNGESEDVKIKCQRKKANVGKVTRNRVNKGKQKKAATKKAATKKAATKKAATKKAPIEKAATKKAPIEKAATKKAATKKADTKDNNVVKINLTRKQCMEERTKMAADEIYINSSFKCEDCIKGFNFKAFLDKHMEKHDESNGDYECNICKQRMNSKCNLRRHQIRHYVRYKCKVCELTRVCVKTVKEHYNAFHAEFYLIKCPHCPKTYKRDLSLRCHISYAHSNTSRVQCSYCGKTYRNKDALKTHSFLQHPNEVCGGKIRKAHICKVCGMAFSWRSRLKLHSQIHSSKKEFYCVECDKSYKNVNLLKQHLKIAKPHVDYVNLLFACPNCDKRFSSGRCLESHLNRVHLKINPYQCDKCDKAYPIEYSLQTHKKKFHSNNYEHRKKFPCTMCEKSFYTKNSLKHHVRIHTGDRPYRCTECPATFNRKHILGYHVKYVHLKMPREARPKPKTVESGKGKCSKSKASRKN